MNHFTSIQHLPPEKVKSVAMYFAQKNLTASEISKKLKITEDEVNEIIFRLRLKGELPAAQSEVEVSKAEMVNSLGSKLSEAMGIHNA